MTSTTTGQLVLKQDARGRVRYSQAHREKLLKEFNRNWMSGANFSRLSGIRCTTFAGWIKWRERRAERKAQTTGAEKQGGSIRLVEAMVEDEVSKPEGGWPDLGKVDMTKLEFCEKGKSRTNEEKQIQ